MTDEAFTEVVSLSYLRLLTHESPSHEINIGLFDWFSLLSTCDAALAPTPRSSVARIAANSHKNRLWRPTVEKLVIALRPIGER